MILEQLGVLSTAQALLTGAVDSENVIDLGAVANVGLNEAWLSIQTSVIETGADTDTYKVDVVISNETTLDTNIKLLTIDMVGTDPRLKTINREWAGFDIGPLIGDMIDGTKRYLGLIFTLANVGGTAAVTINAALSPSKPGTKFNTQVIRSNVGVPT